MIRKLVDTLSTQFFTRSTAVPNPTLATKVVDKNKLGARMLLTRQVTECIANVEEKGNVFQVDLQERTCSCNYYKDMKLPCTHICAFLLLKNESTEYYVDTIYSENNYTQTYSIPIVPPAFILSFEEEVLPPLVLVRRGRRRMRRMRRNPNRILPIPRNPPVAQGRHIRFE